MQTETKTLFAKGWGTACVLTLIGACSGGLEPATDEAALTRLVPEERAGPVPTPLASQPSYAQAVDSTSTAGVLQPAQALGPPDGQAALVLSLPGAALVLDMGEGTEGTGDLEVSYRNATVEVLTWVEFLRADKSVISTGPLRLANLELGTHTTTVPYQDKPVPYRYVRMTGVLALYGVDAVRNMGSDGITCGDGQPNEGETCDDANRTSGDGCSRDCQKEAGFRCESTPSVCTDIDECAERLDNCAAGFSCINRPGSFFCWEGVCRPPHSVCGNQCFNLYTDKENCGRCGNRCGWRDVCARGVCKTIGKLAFTLSWSRPGNGDLIVRAPGGIHYSAQNPGPEGQELFVFDDQDGKGPEVVYWAPGVEPDLGDYNICFEARSFDPAPSFNNPVSASATYLGPWNGTTHLGSTTVTAHSTGEPECGRPTRGFVGRMTYWGSFAPEPSAP